MLKNKIKVVLLFSGLILIPRFLAAQKCYVLISLHDGACSYLKLSEDLKKLQPSLAPELIFRKGRPKELARFVYEFMGLPRATSFQISDSLFMALGNVATSTVILKNKDGKTVFRCLASELALRTDEINARASKP